MSISGIAMTGLGRTPPGLRDGLGYGLGYGMAVTQHLGRSKSHLSQSGFMGYYSHSQGRQRL